MLEKIKEEVAQEAFEETQKLLRNIDAMIKEFTENGSSKLTKNERMLVANRAICGYGMSWSTRFWSACERVSRGEGQEKK